mgnify:CR=1 FL=1
MKTLLLITATLASGIAYAEGELPDRQTELPAVEKPQDNKYLVPRDLVNIPAGEFGDKVKQGYSLFVYWGLPQARTRAQCLAHIRRFQRALVCVTSVSHDNTQRYQQAPWPVGNAG